MPGNRSRISNAIVVPSDGTLPDKDEVHHGHRSRLLERYIENGIDAFHPHEILELLLTFTIKRHDTKKIAHALLMRFKTISAVCNAPVEELVTVEGIGRKSAVLLIFVRDLLAYCLKEKFEHNQFVTHRKDVESYLKFTFGLRSDEYVAAIFLDSAHHIIKTALIAEGTVNQCAVYPRMIIDKALRCGAASIIIAHNHPGGTPEPSENDWQITDRLYRVGKLLDIPLLDHILICSEKTISLMESQRWPGKKERM